MKKMDEFVIILDRQVVTAGGTLYGRLIVTFVKPVNILCIKVALIGEARGRWYQLWKEQTAGISKEDAGEVFHNLKLEKIHSAELILFGEDREINNFPHKDGRYAYDFQFRLPQDLPQSFRCTPEKDLGCAKYYIMATLSRENKMDISIKKPFVVNQILYEDNGALMCPPGLEETKVIYHCFGKGHIKILCSLKQSCYGQTEALVLSNYIENHSRTTLLIPFAKLIQKVSHGKKFFHKVLREVTDEPLHPNCW